MKNNLPKLSIRSAVGVEAWYRDLQKQGRVFHPDDDPASVINSVTREPIFSAQEGEALRSVISDIREILNQGHQGEDSIYEIAMRYSGVPYIAPLFESYTKPQDGQPAILVCLAAKLLTKPSMISCLSAVPKKIW